MNRFIYSFGLIALCILIGFTGCAEKTVPNRKKKKVEDPITFTDDLSQYRPVVAKVQDKGDQKTNEIIQNDSLRSPYDISKKLNVVLDTIRQRNFDAGELSGYTILVYSGTNETEAGRIKNSLYELVPELEPRVTYSLPTYFVKIGRFYQQVEAQPLYQQVKRSYPDATVVPDKFPIN